MHIMYPRTQLNWRKTKNTKREGVAGGRYKWKY